MITRWTEGSVTFGRPPGLRHIPGLGSSRRPEILDPNAVDDVVHVPERAAVANTRSRGTATGLRGGRAGL